jgi:hypothetical protein
MTDSLEADLDRWKISLGHCLLDDLVAGSDDWFGSLDDGRDNNG